MFSLRSPNQSHHFQEFTRNQPIESDADVDVSDQPAFEVAPIIKPQSFETYSAYLSKGDLLTIQPGADDWIRVELASLTESDKLVKARTTIGSEGKKERVSQSNTRRSVTGTRTSTCSTWLTPLEVGVTLTVE